MTTRPSPATWLVAGASLFALVCTPLAARAAPSCPGLGAEADAAEQVVCWAGLDARGDASCAKDACIGTIRSLCSTAALDNPAVGHACFLANVRAGDFKTALGLADYLQEPTTLVTKCQQALTSVAQVHVVSNPAGAIIDVDGVEYGAAPVTVTLKSRWWERHVRAKDPATGAAIVDVSEFALRTAFDTKSCAMGDLVVAGPKRAALPGPTPQPQPRSPVAPMATSPAPEQAAADSGGSSAWIWTLTGGVLAGGGALAFKVIGDGQYKKLQDKCAPSCSKQDVSSGGVKTSDALMVTFGIASGALLVTTVIIAVASGGSDDEQESGATARAPGALWSGTF